MWSETLPPIQHPDAVDERARDLEDAGLNGIAAALMSFDPPAGPAQARMELHFINTLHVADILADITAGTDPAAVFSVSGGHRVPAGPAAGQVQCVSVSAGLLPGSLILVLEPIGDYSTYRLDCLFDPSRIDPYFSALDFKFRPGCFSNDCDPGWTTPQAPLPVPAIDYLAKDYDSFRHTMISAMMERVPGWQPTSEADFDQVLIDLFSAAADELSDYQDRVMNEAYLATARSRISLARHARLMDYHIHQGQQSTTWVALTIASATVPFTLPEELVAWTGGPEAEGDPVVFASRETELDLAERTELHPGYNRFELHTWAGAEAALPAGATGADIVPTGGITAGELRDAINERRLKRLLISEELNPLTGARAGFDRRARQPLALAPNATLLRDPLLGIDIIRVNWRKHDALKRDYAFRTRCPNGPVDNISTFFGNLLQLHQGLPVITHYYAPGTELPEDGPTEFHRHYRTQSLYGATRTVLADLPHEALPLAYREIIPGGQVWPRSSLNIMVEEPGGATDQWDEVISLVGSDDSAENGDHFAVETDERQQSRLRFGNGVNGRILPAGAVVHAAYQVGGGTAGNVGADAITGFANLPGALAGAIEAITNPFDVTDGLDPEAPQQILRNVPEAFRSTQLRAVTLRDYIARAEEVPGVARVVASYAWTGSWRTVRLVIDPEDSTVLSSDLAAAIQTHIEAVRLIGEDIEIRPPHFVPVTLTLKLCLQPNAWPEDIRAELAQAFSDGWTPWGERGFFHPDLWSFGQSLHGSQVAERVHRIAGIEHIVSIEMRRFDTATAGLTNADELEMGFDEILLVENDPDHMERGSISFELSGGRQ
jgi:hypothetical protein